MTYQIQHGNIIIVIAKGHHIRRVNAQHTADALYANPLVGHGGIDPLGSRHGAVGLLPFGHKALHKRLHAVHQIDGHLDDILRDLGGVCDDRIIVANELDAVHHAVPTLHQVGHVFAGKHHFA